MLFLLLLSTSVHVIMRFTDLLTYVFCEDLVCFLRVFVLSMFVVLGLVFSILSQEIGWEERLQNEQFCVKWDMKLWAAGRASGL